jgi:tyrosyl-tRNA synthetase
MKSVAESLEIIRQGTVHFIGEKELADKLTSGKPLRVKLGVDPTSPDLHLGHSVALTKLRQFQDLGHTIVLIIGDFTAMVGDPTGRSATRPQLTREEVLHNAETYKEQAFKVLRREGVEVVHNSDWFGKMTYTEVLKLNAQATMQQMLQREDFKNRIDQAQEVRLHEIQYPLMQGWDSVMIRSDVEIGGSDQLFNILVGRDLQRAQGMSQQAVLTMPLLEGLDGVKKMSKSYGNYIGLSEPAAEIFGKAMSISDQLMQRYYTLLLGETIPADMHPMEAKKSLAARLTARFHNETAATAARENWESRFSKKDLAAADLPVFHPEGDQAVTLIAQAYKDCFQLEKSNSQIRQLLQQGSIQLNGAKISDPKAPLQLTSGDTLKLDKTHTVRVG